MKLNLVYTPRMGLYGCALSDEGHTCGQLEKAEACGGHEQVSEGLI